MEGKMTERICFVSLSSYGYFNTDAVAGGGAQRQLYLLSQKLTEAFDIHFVVGDYGQERKERRDSVTLHRAYKPDVSGGFVAQLRRFIILWKAMARADADVYVYRGSAWKATFVYVIARLLRKRFVYNVAMDPNLTEEPASLPTLIRIIFEHALENAEAVIVQTDKQRTILHSQYGVSGVEVPNGYPPADDVLPQDQRESFLWVGRLDKRQKQPDLYLDVAERVPGAQFLMIGPGEADEDYNEHIISRADSISNVTYLGSVEPDEIHHYYRQAIALINTSAYEGFPNTFLEAWRYETPVLSYTIDPERFVGVDIDGCADGDLDRLIVLVEKVRSDALTRETLAEPAAEYFEENLTIESVASLYGDVLARACPD